MGDITLIAAVGKNGELGKDNRLIWHIKEDLQFFKKQTIHKKNVMGINTFYSLPCKLPEREHIVLTTRNIDLGSDVLVYHNLPTLLEYIETLREEVMVIGGASIYRSFIPYANRMILTMIEQEADADVYFPKVEDDEWNVTELSSHISGKIPYKRLEYKRETFY